MADEVEKEDAPSLAFEREKWLAEIKFKDRELQQRDREIAVQEADLKVRQDELKRLIVKNPLILAIIGATIAAIANVAVAFYNGYEAIQLETLKTEDTSIVSVISGAPADALVRLNFLLGTGLIKNKDTLANIKLYANQQEIKIATAPPPPPPPTPAAKRVLVDSKVMGGGHTQGEVCGSLIDTVKAQYPNMGVKFVAATEDSNKDFLGHVTYQYHCQFDVQ